jgi:toxin ParE1/3/4
VSTDVGWSPEAIDAFEEICEHLLETSPRSAERFASDVFAALARISTFPEIGRVVPEENNPRLREIIVPPYRLIYRLHADGATLETIMHGAVEFD